MVGIYQNREQKKQPEKTKLHQIIEHYKQQGTDLNEHQIYNLKFIHKKVVFINGMDSQLMRRTDLDNQKYFGQYGKVVGFSFKRETGSLHVTYENKKQASFAIIALSDCKLIDSRNDKNNRQYLKVYFGTSKFCLSFLKGQKCRNLDCQFIHELKKVNQIFSKNKLSLSSAYRTAQKSRAYLKKWSDTVGNGYAEFPKIVQVEQKLEQRTRNRRDLQKKDKQLETDRSYNHRYNDKYYRRHSDNDSNQQVIKSQWDQSCCNQQTNDSLDHQQTNESLDHQQINQSLQNQQINESLENQQTSNLLDNQLDIANSDQHSLDDIFEEKNINFKIVKRFLYEKIRNHKSRFEFAQE